MNRCWNRATFLFQNAPRVVAQATHCTAGLLLEAAMKAWNARSKVQAEWESWHSGRVLASSPAAQSCWLRRSRRRLRLLE